jgi:mercuric ion transport protein
MQKKKPFLLGGVVASLFASACCLGPLFFAGIGLSTFGLFSSLETWRPFFISIALTFLGLAFFITYRQKKQGSCDYRPPRVGQKNKVLLFLSTLIILLSISFPYWSAVRLSSAKDPKPKDLDHEKVYFIQGMTCAGCIVEIEKIVAHTKQVLDYQVHVGKMVLRFDTSELQVKERDCLISSLIERQTSYRVYLDPQLQKKACEYHDELL